MESLLVGKYMSQHPVKLTESMPVAEAVEKLLQNNHKSDLVLLIRMELFFSLEELIVNL